MTAKRPSHSTIVAYLALFVAIGGTAAALPGRNTVNSGDVIDETLKTRDLKNGAAVQGSDVINESLTEEDLALDSVRRGEIQEDGVDTEEIATGSVTEDEIAFSSVKQSEVADGAIGTGEIIDLSVAGADIAAGAVDESKLGAISAVQGNVFDFGDQDSENGQWLSGSSSATCPAGTRVIGGGFEPTPVSPNEELAVSRSVLQGNGWSVNVISDTDNTDFRAIAYCLD